ncbi:MAG TPA: glycoside hydrolase family 78 protein [Chitinophagaceae bacterium]|nr:glycoside hydrolase family 78 protein [Chitinophagaceae bacterium]
MKKGILLISLLFISIVALSQVTIKNMRCENLNNPLGIDVMQPRLSWQLISDKRNTTQAAYEIKVSDNPALSNNIAWSSGKVTSGQSVYISYEGTPLQSAKKYYWQVRVWDNTGNASPWSKVASWQMGLLKPADWKAKWIESNDPGDSINAPALLFRKQFNASKKIGYATVFITSHGMYEAEMNGKRIGDAYLAPGWTSYNKRLQYQAYEVTSLLKQGRNAIGVTVGSGWYRTPLAWNNNKNLYGNKSAVLCQLEITYSDGSKEIVGTDGSWRSSDAAIRNSEIYGGETYDANYEKANWSTAQYDDKTWNAVTAKDHDKNILIATINEPIKKHEVFKPVKIITTPQGDRVIDFGQNLVGWSQIKVNARPDDPVGRGKAGDKIIISHAEVLDKKGNFYTDNLRAAKAQNVFILKGNGEEFFEPHFTFQGFRYIKVEGYPGELKPENFSAVALYSDMEPTGSFECSNALLNQLQHNIQWGQKGNFLDVPTDCPQRDERLGWTGDAQAFSRTATFNMQAHNFFAKWLKDVAADQGADGRVPFVIPNVLGPNAGGSAGWADAATIIPWNIYLAYADKKVLEDQYPSMKAWIGFMEKNSTDFLWNKGFHFGDWLFYRPDDDNSGRAAVTDKYLIAQCFFAHSTQLMINAAKVLGRTDDIASYATLLQHIKDAFLKEYVTGNGRLTSGTQTAYVLALNFDMLPENSRQQAAERLVANIKDYDHLTTGFLGTPYLCHVLTRFGYDSVAYKLLLRQTYPSWLYPVKMGATTIWERWDGQKPDSTFQTPGMNSFNHYAYGAIGDWMYRVITGIDTDEEETGYKKIIIKPHPGGNLTYANADYETMYGKVSSHWKKDNGHLTMDVEIPANTSAKIYIPSVSETIKESGKNLSAVKEVKIVGKEGGYIIVEAGSGIYHFTD